MLIRIYIGLTVAINFTKFSLQKGEGIGVSTWNWKSTGMHKFPTFTPPSCQCLRNTALQCGIWVSWDEFTLSPSNVFWDVRTWNCVSKKMKFYVKLLFQVKSCDVFVLHPEYQESRQEISCLHRVDQKQLLQLPPVTSRRKREWKIQNFLRPRQTWGKCDIESSNAKCEGSHSVNSMALQWF